MGFFKRFLGQNDRPNAPAEFSDNTSLGRKLTAFRRKAWLPKTKKGDCAITGSKFSGLAYIPLGEEWPRCGNCHKPMQLFLQLRADDVPDDAREVLHSGTLQLFYCTSSNPQCEVDCEAFFPFSKAHMARIVEDGPHEDISESPVSDAFPARSIVGWSSIVDVPNWEELEHRGIGFEDDEDDEADVLADSNLPRDGEKLGGWPAWIQGVEYPNCPRCDQPMEFVFQIDSDRNIPFLLGDAGIGHITRCKTHPEVLTFGWACG